MTQSPPLEFGPEAARRQALRKDYASAKLKLTNKPFVVAQGTTSPPAGGADRPAPARGLLVRARSVAGRAGPGVSRLRRGPGAGLGGTDVRVLKSICNFIVRT